MRSGIFPIFTKGRVLKKESIEYLRDFPYDLASLAFMDCSDGILFGFTMRCENGRVIVSKGAVKHQGNVIIVPEEMVEIPEYGQFLYAKLAIGECRETLDYKICPVDVRIDKNMPSAENELELGRFCLNHGAVLRCEYDSFSDLRTPENTLDITCAGYAGVGGATLHPRVTREYAQALMECSSDAADIAFALMCLNSGVISKSSIQWHIAKKSGNSFEEFTQKELYERLLEMLPQHGRKGRPGKTRGRGPSIQ